MTVKKEKTCACVEKDGVCNCGKDCSCGCNSGCGKTKMIVKSGVMLACAILISGAILTAGYDGGSCDMPRGDKFFKGPRGARQEQMMHDYIMKNPKVLIDSVDAYYKAQQGGAAANDAGCGDEQAKPAAPAKAPEAQVASKELVAEIVADSTNHVLGNPKGKFVIIEFFDYQCGWCKKTNKEIGEAVKTAKNIRWILIDTPIFGAASEKIAHYAIAAGYQGKFKEYHEGIVAATGRLDEPALIKLGKDLGLDTKKLQADANGDKVKAKMAKNQEYAKELRIGGVPMLIVDGKINPGALIGERLADAVKASNEKK